MLCSQAEVFSAKNLEDALKLRAAHPEAMPLAGGTDVMVLLESDRIHPPAFLNLWGCKDLRTISADGLQIGSLCTWSDLLAHPKVQPALKDCARTVGAEQIQRRGTVGGNIANASPAGDSLPLWLALDAVFVVASLKGSREVPAAAFFQGYRKTDLAPDELVVAVKLPKLQGVVGYRKVGTRLAQAISKVVFAGRIVLKKGVVEEVRIALGAVAPVPLRAKALEAALLGGPVRPELASLVAEDIAPIDDVRSDARYRGTVAENLVRRWLGSLGDGSKG